MEPETGNCSIQPSIAFLAITLIMTATATATLCTSILTENWEYITWNRDKLKAVEREMAADKSSGRTSYNLEWLLDEQVARVVLDAKDSRNLNLPETVGSESERESENNKQDLPALFFVPVHGGIWTFCIAITAEQHKHLSSFGFPRMLCSNYLKMGETRGYKTHRQHRMQNLSISCALVCLIILGSSGLTGIFGITKHQISAVLVTGVMYLLAGKATFAIFSLTIINFKRAHAELNCFNGSTAHELIAEGVVLSNINLEKLYSLKGVNKYFYARVFSTGWSLILGWAGAGMCILASILWIFLSKIMRYNPLYTLHTVV